MYLLEVSPLSKGIREPSLTYHSPVVFERGEVVTVPLRASIVEAIVLACAPLTKEKQALRKERQMTIKSIVGKKSLGRIDEKLFRIAEQLSLEHFISVGSILAATIPDEMKLAVGKKNAGSRASKSASKNSTPKTTTLIGPTRNRWQAFLKKSKGASIIVLPTKQAVKNCADWIKIQGNERQCTVTTPHEAYALVLGMRSAKKNPPTLLLDMSEHIAWKDRKQPFISHVDFLSALAAAYGMPVSIGAHIPPISMDTQQVTQHVGTADSAVSISYRDPESRQSNLEKTLAELWSKGKRRIFILSPRTGVYGYIECQDCKTTAKCPSCGLPIGVALYDEKRAFSCGHCGFEDIVRDVCANCHGHRLNLRSPGTIIQTKEVAEATADLDPQPITLGLDKTIEKTPAKAAGMLAKAAALDHIVIGTSYVLEHIPFDRFDAAIIMKPETLLAYPDYRSVARARLLLSRLGDFAKEIACIDARPDSGLDMVLMSDEEFIKSELSVRKAVRMPPFARLCRLEYTGPRGKRSTEYIASLVGFCAALEKELGLTIRPLPILNGPKVQRFAAIITLPADYIERTDIQRSLRTLPPWATCIVDPESISW